jgi:hypothetical protein
MANKVISWLESVGAAVKKDVQIAVGKVLPIATEVAQEAEPLVDLALPTVGPIYNATVTAVISTEKAYAALGTQNMTGAQKLQAVLSQVSGTLLPQLEKAGLTGDAANTAMTNYVNAMVAMLNGPAIAGAAQAAPAGKS